MKSIWIVQRCWDHEGFEIVAVTNNKRIATAIMAKVKGGDSIIIEKFPILTSIKNFKEKLWT